MKKIVSLVFGLVLTCNIVRADFAEYYNAGQQYLSHYQYSSAIGEFKKALRINYLDDSARVGLVNSYLARGTYSANNERNWEDAANDYRAALFYLKYYPSAQDVQNASQAISGATQNLNQCLAVKKFNTSAQSRYNKAKELRLDGLFAEAGYEFAQASSESALKEDCYGQIADIMKVLGNDPKSEEYYAKAIQSGPDNAGLRLKHARVLDRLGKNDEAVQEYNYALANGGQDPEILYALERIYRQKLAQSPKDAATVTNLGAILQKQNRLDEALQLYTQAGQLDPTNVTTKLNIGTLYQQKQSYDAAIAAYDSILFLNPDNKEANTYKAQCLAAMGQNDKAMVNFKKVLSIDPTNQEAKEAIFNSLKATKSPAEIMAYLQQNSCLDKTMIDDMYNYAIDLHKQNKLDDAIAAYKEVLKVKTDNPEVYVNLAIAYKQKQDLASAKQILADAKSRFPNNKQIVNTINSIAQEAVAGKFDEASTVYNSGDYQKALSLYQSIQPPSFDSLSGIGACYKGLNKDDLALEYYKKAFDLKPNSDTAYYIGVLYSEKEKWASSKTYLKKALELNPNNSKAEDLIGSVNEQLNVKLVDDGAALYEKGEYTKATVIFNNILQTDPKNAYSYYYKGLIFDAGKKYLLAIGEYQKAIKYSSELTLVYYLMAIDYDSLSQFKSALLNYKKYVAATKEDNEYTKYAKERITQLKKYE